MAESQTERDRHTLLAFEAQQQTEVDPVASEGQLPAATDEEGADFDAVDALLRLVVGGACNLTDLLLDQLQETEEAAASRQATETAPANDSISTLLRYALIGQIFETQRRLRGKFVSVAGAMLSIADGAARSARPITDSRLAAPARRRASALSAQVMDETVRLIQIGRQEEALGRTTSREVADHIMDDIFDYMAENPEVAELVRQQGRGMVAENLDVVRLRTANRDSSLETIVRNLLHRPPRSQLNGAPDVVKRQADNGDEKEPT